MMRASESNAQRQGDFALRELTYGVSHLDAKLKASKIRSLSGKRNPSIRPAVSAGRIPVDKMLKASAKTAA